jgi:hypothetical protein
MNRELIAARCEAGGLSIHAAAMKAWVDPVVLWEDPGSEADDRIPLGVLRRLCSILDVDLTELVETRGEGPDDEDGDVFADDVRVEAALAEFDDGLSRDGLAKAFGWPLERVERALASLENRLRPTGRRLRPIGWHCYALGPNLDVLTTEERSALARSSVQFLTQEEAGALFQIAEGFGSASLFKAEPGAGAVKSLLRQGLIERKRGQYFVSADVAFSLALDD